MGIPKTVTKFPDFADPLAQQHDVPELQAYVPRYPLVLELTATLNLTWSLIGMVLQDWQWFASHPPLNLFEI